jgi:hypothetical protein
MNSGKSALALLLGAVLLSACSPVDLETTPVQAQSAKGPVLCQLYTHDMVYWDRSIRRPDKMSASEADAICVAKGREVKKEESLNK